MARAGGATMSSWSESGDRSSMKRAAQAERGSLGNRWILPRWGDLRIDQVKSVAVEEWLDSIKRAKGTRAKIRNIMSAIFHHAMRYEWVDRNPLKLVRQSTKREKVRGRFGKVKTTASGKPVPLHKSVSEALIEWRKESLYNADHDFLFPSLRLNRVAPLMPDMVLKKIIRPALIRAGVKDKVIGWHSFRHSLATNLRSLGWT